MDLSSLSDEDLMKIVQGGKPSASAVAGPGGRAMPDMSGKSDDELLAILNGSGKKSGFDAGRFDIQKGTGSGARALEEPMQEAAKKSRRKGRAPVSTGGAAAAGYLNWLGMGFADEIVGGIEAGADYFKGRIPENESFGDRWKKRQQDFLDYADDAWEDHPWAYGIGGAGGFAGSVLMTPEVKLGSFLSGASKLPGAIGTKAADLATRRAGALTSTVPGVAKKALTREAIANGALTGGLYGTISGAGEGGEAGLNLSTRALNALIGGGAGTLLGAGAGKAGDWVSNKIANRATKEAAEDALTQRFVNDADEFGLGDTMTYGQRTGDIAAQAKEDMMRKGGYGSDAARIATAKTDEQFQKVQGAVDDINNRLAGTAPSVAHPNEASELLLRDIRNTAQSGQHAAGAGNDADALLARTAADTIETGVAGGSQKLPQDASSFDLGERVGQGLQSRQAASAATRDAAYETAGQAQGVIHRQGVEGMADRIMENLTTGRNLPVIVNERTPAARDALAYLSDVQNFAGPKNLADPLSAKIDPASITGITPSGIEQVRKRLVALSQQANSAARSGDASDKYAMRAIMEEFDNELDRIVRLGMFDGDQNWLDLYKHARGLHAQHRRTFRPDDQLKTAMRDIVERDADPSQVTNYLFGRNKVGDTRLSRDLAEHLRDTLGETSDEFYAIKQHGWQRLVHGKNAGTPEARQITHETAQEIAADIDQFLSNRGRGMAEVLYSEPEREIMRRYAQNLRNLATSRRTPSEALQHMIDIADPSRNIQAQELARMIVGGENTVLNTGTSGRLVDTLLDVYGPDSEQINLVRQAVWRQATTNAEGKDPKGFKQLSNNIAELVSGKGRPVAEKLFTPEQLGELERFQNVLKRMAGSDKAKNHSNTGPALTRWISENLRRIGTTFGMISGGIDGGITGFVYGQGAKAADDMISGKRAARLFGGQRDISVTRGIRKGAERVGQSTSRKAMRYSGQGSGGTLPQLVERGQRAVAGEDEED